MVNPEVAEIKDLYAKAHKDRNIDDEWSPSNVSKLIDNQKIKGIKEITSAMSPKEAVGQYIYNNFFAVNSELKYLKASDLPRFKKAINDYRKLPKEAKKIFDEMDTPNIVEGSNPEKLNGIDVVYLGKNDYMNGLGSVISLDMFIGDIEYYKNTSSLFLPYDSRDIITEGNYYKKIFEMLLKTAYLEELNNIKPSPEEMASKYKNLYSNLLNLKPEDINEKNKEKIFMEIYDYYHLTDDAKNLVKDQHEKIEKLVADAMKSFNTPYKVNTERYKFEQDFISTVYTLKAQKNKGTVQLKNEKDALEHGGSKIINSPIGSEKEIGGKIYGTDGIIYRFKSIEYITGDNEKIKINLTMTNNTDKEIELNGETPFISSRYLPGEYEGLIIFKKDSETIRINPKSTVEVSFSTKLDSDLMRDMVESIKNSTYRVIDEEDKKERSKYATDNLEIILYDSKGHDIIGGSFISGLLKSDELNMNIKGITIDGQELIDIINPVYEFPK